MMQILGHVFVSIIIAVAIVVGDYYLPGTFFTKFIDDHFIETFAVLVGFNITSVVFLLGQLVVVKDRFLTNKTVFENTVREIKHSSYFLLISFLLSLTILVFRPDLNSADIRLGINTIYYAMDGAVVMLFCLAVVSVFEILGAIFKLSKA